MRNFTEREQIAGNLRGALSSFWLLLDLLGMQDVDRAEQLDSIKHRTIEVCESNKSKILEYIKQLEQNESETGN